MTLKQILIGLGLVAALTVALVVVVGYWGASGVPPKQTIETSFGNHLVIVKGHYKNLTQESMADGLVIAVDGHEIMVNDEQITIDGVPQVLESGQNVEIEVDEGGAVRVKTAEPGAGDTGEAPE